MRHQYPATGCVRGGRAVVADHHALGEVFPTLGEGQSKNQADVPTDGTPWQTDL